MTRLTATNEGDDPAPVDLGIHPYLALDPPRSKVEVRIPGARERCYDGAFPTGQTMLRAPETSTLPRGEHSLFRSWTDLQGRDIGVADAHAPARVRITLSGAFSDLALWVPPEQDAVAIEPCTCAISAASLAPVRSTGPTALAPGASITAGMRMSLEEL